MNPNIQTMAKLVAFVVIAIGVSLPTAPSYADGVAYASSNGSGTACTFAQPCADLPHAIGSVNNINGGSFGQVICITPVSAQGFGGGSLFTNNIVEVDCPGSSDIQISILNPNATMMIRGVTFTKGAFGTPAILVNGTGSGTVFLENCGFVGVTTPFAIDLEPSGPLNFVMKNCRMSSNNAAILLKPAAGGSINATLDHATITGNAGGGVKIDTTNGPVTLDVTDSVVSNNGGNGINAVGNAGGQAIVSIKNSVIAKNGAAGVQANGANAGVLLATTLLDQNAAGALSVVNSGNMFTYGNNQIVGSQGSDFTGPAGLK